MQSGPDKYHEAFNTYMVFLVKHTETPAIKQLINKLNADVLQIYNEDTEHGSAATPSVDGEDLVAQALLAVQGMIYSFVG